jgi:hypothetical protein
MPGSNHNPQSTLTEALDLIRITDVWTALGGGPLRYGRGRAFWRNGDGFNISVHDGKGWYDHRDNTGGGILGLIQIALGCNRRAAIDWLRDSMGLKVDGAPQVDRRRYRAARSEAERFVEWHEGELFRLRDLRDYHLKAYHQTIRLIVTYGLDHPEGDIWATACEQHEARYQALDEQIDAFLVRPIEASIRAWRTQRRTQAA